MIVVRVIIIMERIKAIAMKWGACLTCLRNENFTLLSLFFFKKNQFSCPIFFWARDLIIIIIIIIITFLMKN